MRRSMFIGAIGCGKTTLLQRLKGLAIQYDKTQSVEFYENIVDTPGEYIEHRRMYTNLATTAMDVDLVVMLQSATDKRLIFPEAFSTMFGRQVIGVVTKIDVADDKDVSWAVQQLKRAGAQSVFEVSALNGDHTEDLRQVIDG
ncbi:EutP/PduV family microcompartment system protein [Levilactobacillus yiduensis]|uniref:EutP/PduV family microcompartment system protein n=1 Tax=Levilactobacillus yiduensis TaxID=2953880 RepID=UPI000EF31387|nr:EutP/PduV family microcompartment system protein [Levilactobacillus yiduensis]AYM02415.1 EutP/PduV family microcompartment system protein [Levilactobacillus brevis]